MAIGTRACAITGWTGEHDFSDGACMCGQEPPKIVPDPMMSTAGGRLEASSSEGYWEQGQREKFCALHTWDGSRDIYAPDEWEKCRKCREQSKSSAVHNAKERRERIATAVYAAMTGADSITWSDRDRAALAIGKAEALIAELDK